MRQAHEPEDAYQAFVSFRSQIPPRDIRRVTIHNVVVPMARVSAWSQAWDWFGRVTAHDNHFESRALNERERVTLHTARKTAERHGEMLHRAYELCMREVSKLNALSAANEFGTCMKPTELTRMMRYVVELQRLILDQSTANVEIQNKDKIDAMSVDALEELDRLFKRAGVET